MSFECKTIDMSFGYKIVEMKNDQPHTLFHGVEGSRKLSYDEWYKAENKMVVDGGNQKPYLSAFHILLTLEDAEEYLKKFKKPRELKIVPCMIRGKMRPKRRSPSNVFLVDEVRLIR